MDPRDDFRPRIEAALEALQSARAELETIIREAAGVDHPKLNGYLRAAKDAGFTLQELGDMLGVSRQRVQQRIQRDDLDEPFRLTPEEVATLRDLHAKADGRARSRWQDTDKYRAMLAELRGRGATLPYLAEVVGVSHGSIHQQLRRYKRYQEAA